MIHGDLRFGHHLEDYYFLRAFPICLGAIVVIIITMSHMPSWGVSLGAKKAWTKEGRDRITKMECPWVHQIRS